MRESILALVLTAALLPAVAQADETLDQALTEDVILRALVDELDRSFGALELKDMDRPYFIEYALYDTGGFGVSAEFGAVTSRNEGRSRSLRTDVRVGSYELDNTNFGGGGYYGRFGGRGGYAPIPIEDDYNAIRQGIWWTTDRDYKSVVESLAQKRAFMKSKMIEDKPDDFSHEEPVTFLEDRVLLSIDKSRLEKIAVTLSSVFREYPDIQDSGINVSAGVGNKYLVNTEGTRLRTGTTFCRLGASAKVQADDGMRLSDSFDISVLSADDIPSLEQLEQRCRKMIEQLIAVKNAPKMEEPYAGPVLFEPEAATSLFSQHFASQFGGGQRPVGSRTSPDDFVNKLNRRILPRFMHVVDDPTLEMIEGKRALGYYHYDDQGVKAERIELVERGRLKALLMSRNPSKEFPNSNGHGRGLMYPRSAVSTLIVTADPAATADEMKQELLDACQDEGLEYGVRVVSLGSYGSSPLIMYKVFADGHEELVRGAEIAGIDLKSFKRMLAAGDAPYVQNSGSRSDGTTIVAPAMLFEELDLAKIDRDFDKPPILTTPLARGETATD